MHDLIHDMAVSFSMDECFVLQDLSNQNNSRMPSTVRHMSIEVDGESLTRMGDIQHFNKLHSLRFRIGFDVKITWFNQLSNILYLSLKGCKLVKLPESICELASLRYLDISSSRVQELPKKLWCLYSLQVLDARHSSLKTIHGDVTKLINLRQLALPMGASHALSRVSGLGNLSCLRNLRDFRVAKGNGRGIGELKFMNELSGRLIIRSLAKVGSEEEAAEARLIDKQRLKELVLKWRELGTSRLMANENGVLERLCPHSRVECLRILGFGGDMFPSWFNPVYLPTLRSLDLSDCFSLESLSIPWYSGNTQAGLTGDGGMQHASSRISRSNLILSFPFTRLTDLHVYYCRKLTSLEQFLTPEILPSIKSIVLEKCPSLASIPVHRFVHFVCLQDLKICQCCSLDCQWEMVLPLSLRRLCIVDCNELDRSFPACLENLASLTILQLAGCNSVKCIPLNSIGSNMLKCLVISRCQELSSIGGLQSLASIQHVQLSGCPNLTEVQLPFEKRELRTKEGKELLQFLYPESRPFLPTASTCVEELGCHFTLKQSTLLPDMPCPATVSMPDFSNVLEVKSGHREGVPARPVGDAERSPEAEPAGDPQVGVCVDSIRRLFQQLVHVRTTISSFGGKLPSDAWFNHVKHLTSDAEESLEHLHYKIILANLGVGTHLKKELVILPVTDKLEGLRHASPGLSGAVIGNYSNMLSLSSSVMRCIFCVVAF